MPVDIQSNMRFYQRLQNISELKKEYFFFLVLAFAGLLVFAPSLQIPFISDEVAFIKRNTVSDLMQLPNLFEKKDYDEFYYRPLGNFVSGILTFLAGDEAFFYRFFNVLLHIANTFIFFQFAKVIFQKIGNQSFAYAAALLFLVFPGNDYALLWHTALFDRVLFGLYFLGILSFLKNFRVTIPSLIFFILAMLSKEAAFSFPFVIFTLDYLLNEKEHSLKSAGKKSGVYFLFLAGFLLLRILLFNNNVFTALDAHSSADIFTIIKNYFFFGGFLLFPFSPRGVQQVVFEYRTVSLIVGGFGLVAFLFLSYKKRTDKLFWLILLFIILTILPASRLFMRWYLYLPSAGFVLLICYLVFTSFNKKKNAALVSLLLILSIYTFSLVQKETEWSVISKKSVVALEALQTGLTTNQYSSLTFLTIPAKVRDVPVYQLQFESLAQYYLKSKIQIEVLSKSYLSDWNEIIGMSADKSGNIILQQNKDNYFLLFDNKKNLNFNLKTGKQLSFKIKPDKAILYVFFSQGKFHKIIGQL
ncbi:MAG: hypothetical protein COW85_04365 [Ignavibacteria bacterium CG22_combo_CG10-13_8_21_14_all_37_15]|nr:MAG: hypothetical protein COW85_04365 [Ignavibacteria bacterium CG22_combo_CG10-13_8_21_14_all_37_15]